MTIDLREFFKATDPSRTLFIQNSSDSKYYIDFSSVRGGDIIQTLKKRITFFQPDEPTCTLFTGHIGCGKSTELIRLQAELESLGFHVVYFESTDDLEITDVGIADVLLAIARRISQSLDKIILEDTNKFNALLQGALQLLNSEVTGVKAKVPGVGDVGFSAEKEKLSLSVGIGEITTKIKSDPRLREKINQYLAPQKIQLLEAINQELLQPAIAKLKQQGKQGLVVIVDNLDRIDNSPKPWGRPQQEYLFVDQGEYLTKLNCHLVYTMPLSLKFSNDYGTLTQRFHDDPKVLPMVSVQYPDGSIHQEGMGLMQQMVLARAFPDLQAAERLEKITEIFDSVSTLERLCMMSGGHVRDLLRLLNSWIMEEMAIPLSRKTLEQVIRSRRNEMMLPISESEWRLLRDVKRNKRVSDDDGYQKLIRSRFVFEYRESGESWFDVNPILAEARELTSL
ncbi:AAA family ATPase [Anabaena minutissima FACHB-250]|nr:AAA family ATPase [Anabaena minutissima FACHB-250]